MQITKKNVDEFVLGINPKASASKACMPIGRKGSLGGCIALFVLASVAVEAQSVGRCAVACSSKALYCTCFNVSFAIIESFIQEHL